MKNINLLYKLLLFINILFLILLLVLIVILVIPDFLYQKPHDDKVLGIFNHLVIFCRGLLLFMGLFKIQQALKAIIKYGFYNKVSEVRFKKGGLFLILFGVIGFIFNIIIKSELELNVFITNFVQYFFVLLVGLGLFVFSDFIKSGTILKEENDLTI
ncbi:DUF2975 domain-containing protein [Flavivirga rizhaonensis]|uniref:DUF2975 domain-containing protein n=1 Tax=Flavivirga rizhaonensis TaxID=2559571 RepID=A0A4S1DTL1_9FLAO|nr:DUF2975 domain-containing protein [Flavivirga rizhaonensis]TGV00712.1 DUF2975 domain-containing protein [Flavivirga rizhaonensis]